MSRESQISDMASRWIIAQEDGSLSDEEKAKLDAWLAESDGNKASYWRLRHSWREADRMSALSDGGAQGNYEPSRYAPSLQIRAAIAASLILLLVAGIAMHHLLGGRAAPVTEARFETRVGGRKIISLPDGSTIDLNTASRLRTDIGDQRREVWLDRGEAYFEVKHNPGLPFVVHAGNRQVTVLGTKFTVRRDGDKVTVAVVEGRVRVDAIKNNEPILSAMVTKGDMAVADGPGTLLVNDSSSQIENSLGWRTGMLNFDQDRLFDVAAEFNRYNAKKLVITDDQVGEMHIGGMFPVHDPEAFVRLLRDAYDLTIVEEKDAIKISS